MKNDLVKNWYVKAYPTDDLGTRITDTLTFEDIANAMKNGIDFYEIVEVADSIIRERIFSKLSEVYGTTYDYWYDLWLAS